MSTHLSQEQFRDAIRKGLGRAILHLKQHGAEPCLEEVIYACTHNTAYDQQCEGSREKYLRRTIALTGPHPSIRAAILDALMASTACYTTHQLFDLARGYAAEGDERARQCIYQKFERNDATEAFVGAGAIYKLDGIEGLLRIARREGQRTLRGESLDDDSLISGLSDDLKTEEVRQRFELEAERDSAVKAILDAVAARAREPKPKVKSKKQERRSFEDLRAEAEASETGRPSMSWFSWAHKASPDDLMQAARAIEEEDRDDRLLQYLRIFMQKTPYPLAPDKLIQLVSSEREDLAHRAIMVLNRMEKHPAIRRLFFDLISSRRHLCSVFSLLKNNFVPGDERFICGWLEEAEAKGSDLLSIEEVHGIGLDLRNVFEHATDADVEKPMLWVYERTPCSLCRSGAVEVLVQHGAASDALLKECRYDCDEGTRKLAIQAIRKRRRGSSLSGP